jgi:hypothetical protein
MTLVDPNPRRKYRPSNGTEGDMFMARWCFKCERERRVLDGIDDPSEGCEILARTLAVPEDDPDFPAEWTYQPGTGDLPLYSARCSAWVPAGEDIPAPLDPEAVIRPLL